jgi:hypothetical protein
MSVDNRGSRSSALSIDCDAATTKNRRGPESLKDSLRGERRSRIGRQIRVFGTSTATLEKRRCDAEKWLK